MFIDNLDHKPTIHRISTYIKELHRKKSRNMAYRRNRIPVRYSEEDIRRLAFGVVLYGGRPPSGPIRMGLPEFDNAPLKKHRSWLPRSPQEDDNREVLYLMGRIKTLAKSRLTIIEVMPICIMRGVQPLQYRGKPMWHFNGEDDATRCGRKGPDSVAALAKILSDLYKGDEEEFIRIKPRDGFSMYNSPSWVSCHFLLPTFSHSSS